MTDAEFQRRSREDFNFMVMAHAKGDPAMYALLRDRELDQERERRQHQPPFDPTYQGAGIWTL